MSKTIKIPVSGDGLITHDGTVSEVILREPTYHDVMALGDPATWCKTEDGGSFVFVDPVTIEGYIARCLVQPKDPILLAAGGYRLARALRGAVLDFFRDDASGTEP